MNVFTAELIGTAVLILLGNGVVAGVVLRDSKAANAGWMVITTGWALAVVFGVYVAGPGSGAHLNPAVTLALAATQQWSTQFTPDSVGLYLSGQLLGAMLGSTLVWLHYLPHWSRTNDQSAKLAAFCTAPAVRHTFGNVLSEFLGGFVLLFGLSALGAHRFAEGLNPLVVGALVLAIGQSLGGTTGYAINPARDFGPRLMHFILPVAGKGHSDWKYAWIPVMAPIAGGICGAWAYEVLL